MLHKFGAPISIIDTVGSVRLSKSRKGVGERRRWELAAGAAAIDGWVIQPFHAYCV